MENHGNLNEVISAQFGESEQVDNGQNLEGALEEKAQEESKSEQNEQTEQFSSKFAALSRKEKAFRDQQADFDRQMQEFKLMREEFETSKAPKEEKKLPLEYRLKANPMETLSELGLDYETLTNLTLNDGKLTTDMQMKLMKEDMESSYSKKFEELQNRLDEKEKAEEESKYQQTIDNYMGEINQFVESNNEEYELIQANNASELVYNVVEEHYNDTGRVLETKEAADAVEAYLMEEAQKLFKVKKLSKLQEAVETPEPQIQRQSSPTLSNTLSSQVPHVGEQKLTNDQSKAKIAQLIKWTE